MSTVENIRKQLIKKIEEVENELVNNGGIVSLYDFLTKIGTDTALTRKISINIYNENTKKNECIFKYLSEKDRLYFDSIKNDSVIINDLLGKSLMNLLDLSHYILLVTDITNFQNRLKSSGRAWDNVKNDVMERLVEIADSKKSTYKKYPHDDLNYNLSDYIRSCAGEHLFGNIKTGKYIKKIDNESASSFTISFCDSLRDCLKEIDITQIPIQANTKKKKGTIYEEIIDFIGKENSILEANLAYINSKHKIKLWEISIQFEKTPKDQSRRPYFCNIKSSYMEEGEPSEIFNLNEETYHLMPKGITSIAHLFCQPIAVIARNEDCFLNRIKDKKDLKDTWSNITLSSTYWDLNNNTKTIVVHPLIYEFIFHEFKIQTSLGFISFEFEDRFDIGKNDKIKDAFECIAQIITSTIVSKE